MRILQIVHGLPPKELAGTEICTYELAKSLAKKESFFFKKHKVFIFHRSVSELTPYKIKTIRRKNISITSLSTPWQQEYAEEYKNDKVDKIFLQYVTKVKPDIVHIHHLIGLSAGIPFILKKLNIPYVITLHDFWYLCRCGQMITPSLERNESFDRELCKQCFIQDEKNKDEKIATRLAVMMQILNNAALLIAPSHFLSKKYIMYGIDQRKIKYMDNGINTSNLKGFKRIPSSTFRFGFMGTMIPTKGVHQLIDAFKNIDSPAELHFFGYFPQSAHEYKQQMIEKIKDHPSIIFHGHYHPQTISKVLASFDVLVVPSLWSENSPVTIHEALATKTPIIAARLGGMAEYVQEGNSGLLFEPGNAQDLKRKMMQIMHSKEKRFYHTPPKVKTTHQWAREMEKVYASLVKK